MPTPPTQPPTRPATHSLHGNQKPKRPKADYNKSQRQQNLAIYRRRCSWGISHSHDIWYQCHAICYTPSLDVLRPPKYSPLSSSSTVSRLLKGAVQHTYMLTYIATRKKEAKAGKRIICCHAHWSKSEAACQVFLLLSSLTHTHTQPHSRTLLVEI